MKINSEPLKNKINKKMYSANGTLINSANWIFVEDVKDAVEWLKENISGETITIQTIKKQIDEAFEDVTKK